MRHRLTAHLDDFLAMERAERFLELLIRGQVEAIEKFLSESQLSGAFPSDQAQAFREKARLFWNEAFAQCAGGHSPSAVNSKTAQQREDEIIKFGLQVMPAAMEQGGGMWRACIRGSNGHPPRPEKVWRTFEAVRLHMEARKPIRTTVSKLAWDLYKRMPD